MDYRASDSSGTDDDLPPTHQNRFQRGSRPAGNSRAAILGSAPSSRAHNDMETQIHVIEQEAYCSLLRAFKAQSDAITWEKESLITELRKELRVSDEEHRELLARANGDETIRRIRQWRKTSGFQPSVCITPQPIHDPVPSPAVSGSRKKQKVSQSMASLPMGPSPAVHPSMQPSSALRRGPPPPRSKTKKVKPDPSSFVSGRPLAANRSSGNDLAHSGAYDPAVGQKVWTRWPEDNHFYEAVITDYNPVEGLHLLSYDINTANESWEWVNLKDISPEDIRWEGEDPGVARKDGRRSHGRGIKKSQPRDGPITNIGRGRGTMKTQLMTQNGIGNKKALDDIEILHTDTLIKEVEKVFGSSNPESVEVEKAKRVLRDHEQALIDAIAKLEEIADGESDEGGGRQFG